MDSNSVAVFLANQAKHRNGDVNFTFRQDNSLWYLTGFPEDRSALVLTKNEIVIDGNSTHEILFVQESNAAFAAWVGDVIGIAGAKINYGFKAVKPIGGLKSFLDSLLRDTSTLYYTSQTSPFLRDPVTGFQLNVDKEFKKDLSTRFPQLKIKSNQSEVAKLRGVKSSDEIKLIRKAIDATTTAHIEAIKSCLPGMYEYQLQAVIEYCFKQAGAEYTGFPSIIGSGPNSTILHYEDNCRRMNDGDLVVMDIGAEYHGYTGDVTRTIPVNGKFSPEQREIYTLVYKAQQEAIKQVNAGAKFNDAHQAAVKIIEEAGYRKYFIHGTSHHIGLDVHDVGGFGVLKPGMVITVEPGIYIPKGSAVDQKYWNIGVRIEDDVLVTDTGCIVLSEKAPRTIEEIESLMKKTGIGNQPVGDK